jgi:hypothetical protein
MGIAQKSNATLEAAPAFHGHRVNRCTMDCDVAGVNMRPLFQTRQGESSRKPSRRLQPRARNAIVVTTKYTKYTKVLACRLAWATKDALTRGWAHCATPEI